MKLIKLVTLASALSFSSFAADSEATGSITLSGIFSPKVSTVSIALVDCGADVSFNDCDATLASTNFGSHTQDASLGLGTFNGESNTRFVKFEIKSKMLLFKGDTLKISKSLDTSSNDVTVALEKMIFVSAGSSLYGQQTLGDTSSNLSNGSIMVDTKEVLTNVPADVYDSGAANPGVANAKVLSALLDNTALTVRGIISLEAGDEATSDNFSAKINVALTGIDGL
ncbi:hypothetical protein ABMA75_02405 [Halobacteriovorax sp. ZH4_bin.1]|uniref:hypothetical protein n=1 Tax=unclassified Halobacteriovorax TaxID=2639665 RepID=UPI00371153F8